jgi:hypothetical protein
MSKLYSTTGVATIAANGEEFTTDADGGVELPHDLALFLHRQHSNGHPAWEDEAERVARLTAEEAARRADPATLLAAVERLQAAAVAPPRTAAEAKAEFAATEEAAKAEIAALEKAEKAATDEATAKAEKAAAAKAEKTAKTAKA